MNAVERLAIATLGLLFILKVVAVLRNRSLGLGVPSGLGCPAYLFFWPGLRPESFQERGEPKPIDGKEFVGGFIFFVVGVLLQIALAFSWTSLNHDLRLFLGLASFLLTIHLGMMVLLHVLFRLLGWPVEKLFHSPLKSASLREFWGQRWNLAFVDMDKRLFLPLFPKSWSKGFIAFGIFFLSGLLHEIGISYPAGGGWGRPLLYFIFHGFLCLIEPKILPSNLILRRLWVWSCILLPIPVMFHPQFLNAFILPYFDFLAAFASSFEFVEILSFLVLLCGGGHFLILAASFQVPGKLGWKEEFSKLGRFNQKIFWTYGGYIVFCIVSFGFVDLLNVRGLVSIHPSSLAIALFIALFWTLRVIVDFSYFKHDDWPKGDIFVVGHTCLTALFTCLALIHWALVLWQLS